MIDRRQVTMATLVGITAAASPRMVLAQTAMSRITSYGFTFHGLAGGWRMLKQVEDLAQCGHALRFQAEQRRGVADPLLQRQQWQLQDLHRLDHAGCHAKAHVGPHLLRGVKTHGPGFRLE